MQVNLATRWKYAANKLADTGEWIVEDNLPEVKPPRMPDSEDGITLVYWLVSIFFKVPILSNFMGLEVLSVRN